jgi:diguanylate cyclase (GGDEF)-like protein
MLHFATTDSMTELFNRRHFLELADAEWQRFQRYQRPLSLLTIDIDNFKFINDTLGHEAGDRAIMHLARIAKLDKRPSDILGRLGGDEFALLLPETDAEQAEIVAQRLRAAVAENPLEGATMKITISVGGAAATLSMSSIKALMKLADEALYRSKSLGRNRVTWARPLEQAPGKIAAE